MLCISLLNKDGVQRYIDRLREEGASIRDYEIFCSVDVNNAKGYLSSCCGNRELTLIIIFNDRQCEIDIPCQFIDAIYRLD